jgi:hypothetical protein
MEGPRRLRKQARGMADCVGADMAERTCVTEDCQRPARKGNRHCGRCCHTLWPDNPERAKARQRAKTHRRKAAGRQSDVTLDYELELRRKVRRCPLCKVYLTSKPYLPNSKELDHMVPLNVGGTHTIGNVRIICRTCNLARPKDGSDYLGPVTLWAEMPGFVKRPHPQPKPKPKPKRVLPTCQCGALLSRGRCWTCSPYSKPSYIPAWSMTTSQRRERQAKAVAMRDQGHGWWFIADALGFGRESSAFQCVRDAPKATVTDSDSTPIHPM